MHQTTAAVMAASRPSSAAGGARGAAAPAAATDAYAPRPASADSSGSSSTRWLQRSKRLLVRALDTSIEEQSNMLAYAGRRVALRDASALPWFLLSPAGVTKLLWDTLILALVLYSAVAIPFVLSFAVPTVGAWAEWDFSIDIIFLLDIVASFFTSFESAGVLESRWPAVARAYATTWLPLDALASFPVTWIVGGGPLGSASAAGSATKLFQLIRLFKLFRLVRLVKLFPKLFSALETSVRVDPAILRFARSFLALAALWHYIGERAQGRRAAAAKRAPCAPRHAAPRRARPQPARTGLSCASSTVGPTCARRAC